jgi:hypothetical protein
MHPGQLGIFLIWLTTHEIAPLLVADRGTLKRFSPVMDACSYGASHKNPCYAIAHCRKAT